MPSRLHFFAFSLLLAVGGAGISLGFHKQQSSESLRAQTVPSSGTFTAFGPNGETPDGNGAIFGPNGEIRDGNGTIQIPRGASVTLGWNSGSTQRCYGRSVIPRDDWMYDPAGTGKPGSGLQELPNQNLAQTYYVYCDNSALPAGSVSVSVYDPPYKPPAPAVPATVAFTAFGPNGETPVNGSIQIPRGAGVTLAWNSGTRFACYPASTIRRDDWSYDTALTQFKPGFGLQELPNQNLAQTYFVYCDGTALTSGSVSVSLYDPYCGDNRLTRSAGEQCDDGNTTSGNGCSATCQLESGWTCPTVGQLCTPVCGDGLKVGSETCDDHNTVNGDGCRADCTTEIISSSSAISSAPSSSLSLSSTTSSLSSVPSFPSSSSNRCGDGFISGTERCDDGNSLSDDGCSASCTTEPGWSCAGLPSVCTTLCGDGLKVGSEQCDDGNLSPFDACSATCRVQTPPSSSSAMTSLPASSAPRSSSSSSIALLASSSRSSRSSAALSSSISSVPSLLSSIVCGNSKLESGEQCEKGSPCVSGYCSATCQCTGLSGTSSSSSIVSLAPATSSMASASSSFASAVQTASTAPLCGNGFLNLEEQCDEGIPCPAGLFCTGTCQCTPIVAVASSSLIASISSLSSSPSPCGNGLVEGEEQCDDGNLLPLDGCTFSCQQELGYSCSGQPSVCQPVCGDSVRIPPEQCDDGNLSNGDGCSSICELEFAAAPAESSASSAFSGISLCGNGLTDPDEECDDGNLFDGDGCSHLCIIELLLSSSSSSISSFPSLSSSSFAPMPITEPAGTTFPWWWLIIAPIVLIIIALLRWALRRRGMND